MPERWKQRSASLQLTSVTITRFAPACQHCFTTSATRSGLVFAACSGVRSHAMFGFSATTSPCAMNRPIPPRSSKALPHQRARIVALHHHHLRQRGIGLHRVIAPRVRRRGRDGQRAVLRTAIPPPLAVPTPAVVTRSNCSIASRRVIRPFAAELPEAGLSMLELSGSRVPGSHPRLLTQCSARSALSAPDRWFPACAAHLPRSPGRYRRALLLERVAGPSRRVCARRSLR